MFDFIKRRGSKPGPPPIPDYFIEGGQLSEEQIDRKRRSELRLFEEGVRINPHLPCIERAGKVRLREPTEVYRRFVAITLVATCAAERAEGDPHGDIDELIAKVVAERGAANWFTDRECSYLNSRAPDPHESVQLSWRYEAAVPLYWALGQGDARIARPVSMCDVSALTRAARDNTEIASAPLRDAAMILDESDLIFRYHWAVRQSSLDGEPSGGDLHPGVVMERHHALNWLTSYDGADWEDVSTDT